MATEAAHVARLSPLLNQHIHMLGRYHSVEDAAVLRGELRPFADANAMSTGKVAEE
jgi:hypothetical protein